MRVAKAGLILSISGFLLSGISLALGHPGVALKIINLSFFAAFFSCLIGVFVKLE